MSTEYADGFIAGKLAAVEVLNRTSASIRQREQIIASDMVGVDEYDKRQELLLLQRLLADNATLLEALSKLIAEL